MAYLRLRYSDGGIPRFAFMCFVQHIINGQLLITKPGIIGFPMMSGSTCGVRGIQLQRWYSAVFPTFRNVGYLAGYLTGCFSRFRLCPRSRRMPCGEPASLLSSMLFQAGAGDPALRRALLRAKRRPSPLLSFFFDFLHFRHISFFGCDTPGVLRFLVFFGGFSMFATRRCFGLFSTFLGCFMWTYPV